MHSGRDIGAFEYCMGICYRSMRMILNVSKKPCSQLNSYNYKYEIIRCAYWTPCIYTNILHRHAHAHTHTYTYTCTNTHTHMHKHIHTLIHCINYIGIQLTIIMLNSFQHGYIRDIIDSEIALSWKFCVNLSGIYILTSWTDKLKY